MRLRLTTRARLLALALLPLAGMALFAAMWAGDQFEHAERARHEREVTDVAMSLSDISFALQTDERVASLHSTLSGPLGAMAEAAGRQARIDIEHGRRVLDRRAALVDHLAGRRGAWAAESRRLRRLVAQRGPVRPGGSGLSLAQRLTLGTLGDVTDLLPKVAAHSTLDGWPVGAPYAHGAAVRAVEALLEQMAEGPHGSAVATLTSHSVRLHHDATREIFAVLARLQSGDWRDARASLLELQYRQEAHLAAISAVMPAAHRDLLHSLTRGQNRQWTEALAAVRARARGDREHVLPSGGDLPGVLLARMSQISRFQEQLGTDLRRSALARERSGRRQAQTALVIALGFLVATLALAGLLGASIRRPLRRLEARAHQLGRGELDAAPARRRSDPPEIALVSAAFEDLAANLRVVQQQADAVAAGDTDAPVLRTRAPGPLGAALRRSVEMLGDVSTQLRASEALSRAIVASAADAIWTLDATGRILSANPAAVDLLGTDGVGEPVGHVLGAAVAGGQDAPVAPLMNHEVWLSRADGETVPALVSSSRAGDEDGAVWTVFARDISVLKEYEARLTHQAYHDQLTGLPNRALLLDRLERALERSSGQGVALLMVDLDDFKSVNDSLGHAAGDELLTGIARRLERCLRPGDLAARFGGDEFAVLLENVSDPGRAHAVAQRIVELLSLPLKAGDRDLAVAASVGVRLADADSTPQSLLHDADVAMYAAKGAGKGRAQAYTADLDDRRAA